MPATAITPWSDPAWCSSLSLLASPFAIAAVIGVPFRGEDRL